MDVNDDEKFGSRIPAIKHIGDDYEQELGFDYTKIISSKISIWAVYCFIYWTVCAVLVGLYTINNNNRLNILFLYTVIMWIITCILQFSVCAMGAAEYNETEPQFSESNIVCKNLPKTITVVFPFVFVTVVDICVDYGVSIYDNEFAIYSKYFIGCHFINLMFITGMFYGFDRVNERIFRGINFALEWFDILSQIAVILIYNRLSNYEYKDTTLKVYWSIMLIQLFGWCLPIFIGSANSKRYIAIHVCILDILTDLPWIIITIISSAYVMHFWIFIDLFIKVIILIRAIVVNVLIYCVIPKL